MPPAPAAISVESGWSHKDDPVKKATHDFQNMTQELVFAAEAGDRERVAGCAACLQQMFTEALTGRRRSS